tara:strand:- start:4818 stop:5345 length:528 start_codon:yes stop_codon:yes gene_type:complete
MPYGTVKCDNLIYDESGDVTLAVNNINTKNNPTFTGTVTSSAVLNQSAQWNQNGGYHQTLPAALTRDGSNQVLIDCALGSFFTGPQGGVVSQWRFTNVPATGKAVIATTKWYYDGSSIAWNVYVNDGAGNYQSKTVYWAGGSAPTLASSKYYFVSFQTDDGGEKWRISITKAFSG